MEIDEEMRRKIVTSLGVSALFIAALVGVGATFSDNGLTETGGLALVAVIALFVLVMGGLGVFLSRKG